jgi:hypothetical protein
MKDRHRPPVIIIGAHRSGTTATARALELVGLQIGQQLDSHREPRPLQKLHEDYLRRTGGAWHNPQPFLKWFESAEGKQDCVSYLRSNVRQDFARIFGYRFNPKGLWLRTRLNFGRQWGWKEPRTTLFAPAWLEIFPGARIEISSRRRSAHAQPRGPRLLQGTCSNLSHSRRAARRFRELSAHPV